MQFFLITIVTLILIFSLNPLFRKANKKISPRIHVHHSVLGILLLAIGIIVRHKVVAAIGLGIFLGHGVEEIYFNKRNVFAAFFIFVTR
jgi:hypothetical protein